MSGGDAFRTLSEPASVELEVNGSRFVGFGDRASSVSAAEAVINSVESRHPDATHVVPAYRVRSDSGVRAWWSDAGEPSGSAGKPIVNILEKRDVVNVVVVAVRYFGGSELGLGRLSRTYGRVASAVVEAGGVAAVRPMAEYEVVASYDDSGVVRGILESEEVEFEADYGASVEFVVRVVAGEGDRLVDRLLSATSGRVAVEALD